MEDILWDEKNSIEPMKKLESNGNVGLNDITNNIEMNVIKNDLTVIGNEKKKWVKNCPKCGKEQCYSCKNKISKSLKGKYTKENHWLYNKTLNIETINKMSLSAMGDKNSFYGKQHKKETLLNFSENRKGIKNGMFGKTHSEHTKEKMRILTILDLRKKGIVLGNNNFNPNACRYFDELNKQNGWNLQHALNGGEIEICGYFVDGYNKFRNIVVEYDEPHHEKLSIKNKDVIHQNRIINHINPTEFWRYNEKTKILYKVL